MKTTLILFILLLPGFVRAEEQPKTQFYGVDTSDPIVGYLNWNVARNAQIADQLRYEQQRPPVKIEQKIIVQPAQPLFNPYYVAPVAPQPAPVDYGVFNGLVKK